MTIKTLFFVAIASSASATSLTLHDYLSAKNLENSPPFCEMPYSSLDLSHVTADCFIEKSGCGQCLKVCRQASCQYLLVVDRCVRAQDHLDISTAAGPAIVGSDTGIYSGITKEVVDQSLCANFWTGTMHPNAGPAALSAPLLLQFQHMKKGLGQSSGTAQLPSSSVYTPPYVPSVVSVSSTVISPSPATTLLRTISVQTLNSTKWTMRTSIETRTKATNYLAVSSLLEGPGNNKYLKAQDMPTALWLISEDHAQPTAQSQAPPQISNRMSIFNDQQATASRIPYLTTGRGPVKYGSPPDLTTSPTTSVPTQTLVSLMTPSLGARLASHFSTPTNGVSNNTIYHPVDIPAFAPFSSSPAGHVVDAALCLAVAAIWFLVAF